MQALPEYISIGDKYGPAMEIIDQKKADEYFELCVQHTMSFGKSRTEAEEIERQNLGYYSGYYNHAVMERVELLFKTKHPILGSVSQNLTADEVLETGKKFASQQP